MTSPNLNKSIAEYEVSIIVPCYNEEKTILLLLSALLKQTFPINKMEVVIADGLSTDGTREIIRSFSSTHRELHIQLVDNPKRTIPAAVNMAVKHSTGKYIIRLDAHSIPEPDYVALCVNALNNNVAECVGGIWLIAPSNEGWIARSIAAAAANPIAVGDAQYRFATKASYVDTVPFGAFRKDLFEKLGGFNETLLTNEDYEFFTKVRKNNGKIWLDPAIRSTYFARKDIPALIKQYWRYGYWKYKMLRMFPDTLRWRQALPPLFVLTLILLFILSFFSKPFYWLLLGMLFLYLLILFGTGIRTSFLKRDFAFAFGMPLAISCMHISWGSGFLYSIINNRNPALK
jgi:succinoglycan biosynthesis protein ExoA